MNSIPQNFDPENTIFVDLTATLKWSRRIKSTYTLLGYDFTDFGDEFHISIHHLTQGSNALVHVQCPNCGDNRHIRFRDINNVGHTICQSCQSRLGRSHDLTGQVFGRLTVLRRWNIDLVGQAEWLVLCKCGEQKVVRAKHLITGDTKSCGCYTLKYIGLAASRNLKGVPRPNMRRENNPNWNPNITDAQRIKRRSTNKERLWRNGIFERDNYTCQVCHQVGGTLNAHHLHGYVGFPTKRFDLNNGITLCKPCHHEFHVWHGWGVKGRCTKQDFLEWLNTNDRTSNRRKKQR